MTFVPVMWSVWGALLLVFAALSLYKSSLTRDEEDQIFLGDAFAHEQAAQEAIVAKVQKVEPVARLSLWLVAAATLVVIVYYIWDIIAQFK
jgi:anaerobic C4-dicarboxylate transporter